MKLARSGAVKIPALASSGAPSRKCRRPRNHERRYRSVTRAKWEEDTGKAPYGGKQAWLALAGIAGVVFSAGPLMAGELSLSQLSQELFQVPPLVQGGLRESLLPLALSVTCIGFAGFCSGMTLGLLSQDKLSLEMLARTGNESQKRDAERVRPLVEEGHRLLVTLLFCNALANEALPICLDRILTSAQSVVFSTTLVLVLGEIAPQAVCSRYGLNLGARCAPIVSGLMRVTSPISVPCAVLLDSLLGPNELAIKSRNELRELVHLSTEGGELSVDEQALIDGTIEMTVKKAGHAMVPLDKCYMYSEAQLWNLDLMRETLKAGFSRIPVYEVGNRKAVKGLIDVKSLINLNPEDETPIALLPKLEVPLVNLGTPLHNVLNTIQASGVHTVAVLDDSEEVCGIITLTDIMRVLMSENILDHTKDDTDIRRRYLRDQVRFACSALLGRT